MTYNNHYERVRNHKLANAVRTRGHRMRRAEPAYSVTRFSFDRQRIRISRFKLYLEISSFIRYSPPQRRKQASFQPSECRFVLLAISTLYPVYVIRNKDRSGCISTNSGFEVEPSHPCGVPNDAAPSRYCGRSVTQPGERERPDTESRQRNLHKRYRRKRAARTGESDTRPSVRPAEHRQ